MKGRQAQHQYEPLITPESWKGDERRLVMRLTEALDLLFQRQGRLERRISALEKTQEGGKES